MPVGLASCLLCISFMDSQADHIKGKDHLQSLGRYEAVRCVGHTVRRNSLWNNRGAPAAFKTLDIKVKFMSKTKELKLL